MTPEEIKKIAEEAAKKAAEATIESTQTHVQKCIEHELGAYKVPKKQHYDDHVWLSDLREWHSTIKSSAWKAIMGIFVTAVGAAIFYGFVFKMLLMGGGKH